MLIKHSGQYFLARILPAFLNLASLAVFTRLLSPQAFGEYSLVIASVALANAFFYQWLRVGLLRFMPAFRDRREEFLSTILMGFVGLTLVSACIGCALFFLLPAPVSYLFILGAFMLWAEGFFELNQQLVRSQFSPLLYGYLALGKAILFLMIGGGLAYLGWGAYGLLVGMILGMLLPIVPILRRNWLGAKLLLDRSIVRQLFIYGAPLTLTFALNFIISSSDRFILVYLLGVEEAGLYSAGYNLSQQTIVMMMMTINLAAYPLAVRALEEEGEEKARAQLSQNLVLLAFIGIPAMAGMVLLAPNIADVFLGSGFRETAVLLIPVIVLGAGLSGFKSYYCDLSFQLGRKTIRQVWVVLWAAVANLLLNFLLIPAMGMLGAAYATLISYGIGIFLSWSWGRKAFPLRWPGRELAKIGVATTVMCLFLFPMRHLHGPIWLSVQVFLGAVAFGLIAVALNVMTIREKIGRIRFARRPGFVR